MDTVKEKGNAHSQEDRLSSSEKHYLAQEDEVEQQVAVWAMSVGLAVCPENCDELASLDIHALRPKIEQLRKEADRRYLLQGLDKLPNFRAFKPNSAWGKNQTMQWLRANPIKDESSINFVRSKLIAMKKQHDAKPSPRRRQRGKAATTREAISSTGKDCLLPPKVLMARVMGSPGCYFPNQKLPESILLAECKRRALSRGKTLKSILTTYLMENAISNDELRDLMPQVSLLKAKLEPTGGNEETPFPQQPFQQEPQQRQGTGGSRQPSSIPQQQQEQPQQQQQEQSHLSPSGPADASDMNSESSFDIVSDDMDAWSFLEEPRNHLSGDLNDTPTTVTCRLSNEDDLLNVDVNSVLELMLRDGEHSENGKKMTENQNYTVHHEIGTFASEPGKVGKPLAEDKSEDVLEHRGEGHKMSDSSIDQGNLDGSTTVAPLQPKDVTTSTGDPMDKTSAGYTREPNELSPFANCGHQSTAQRSMNQQSHNSERVCAMSITSAETALMNLSIESPPVDTRSNPSDAPSAFSSFPDRSMPSVESSKPMSSRGSTGADQTRHDGNMEGLELHVQPQRVGGDSADDSRTIATVSVLTDVFGSTSTSTKSYDSSSRQKVVDKVLLDPYGDKGTFTGIILRSTGMPHGTGRMKYENEDRIYEGEWRHGRWHGYGRATFANGDSYEGEYRFDQRHGRGKYCWKDGRIYDGSFVEDRREGEGTFHWADGATYVGGFAKGQREGHGRYTFSEKGYYNGNWVDGRYEGYGECQWGDGCVYKGEWKNGNRHGQGVETYADGTVHHDGEWIEDKPHIPPTHDPATI